MLNKNNKKIEIIVLFIVTYFILQFKTVVFYIFKSVDSKKLQNWQKNDTFKKFNKSFFL